MATVAIHYVPQIPWQANRIGYFSQGLANLGIPHVVTESRTRISDIAVLFGTTAFKELETDGPFLLVDRCSFNDPYQYVSLVWDGHGRRGDHKVPLDFDSFRWALHGVPLGHHKPGDQVILCGQHMPYSPMWDRIEQWYSSELAATHFKPHPAIHGNPTDLPVVHDFRECKTAITLNSSVAVQLIIDGHDVIARDEGAMAYNRKDFPTRIQWLQWLAWTQWHWDEIKDGRPMEHLWR